MRNFALSLALCTAALAGCQSAGTTQVPTIDPFAAYGHTRIAPPTTGSYGVANRNPYYPGTSQVEAAGEESMLAAAPSEVSQAFNLVDATKAPAGQASLANNEEPTGLSSPTQLASNESPIRIVERVGSVAPSATDFRGMTAVDACGGNASLAAQTNFAHREPSEPARFEPAEGATSIRVLPSSDADDRPLPVRGFSSPRIPEPTAIPEPTPTSIRPSATIQAGRFVPLNIATRRTRLPQQSTIAAAAGN